MKCKYNVGISPHYFKADLMKSHFSGKAAAHWKAFADTPIPETQPHLQESTLPPARSLCVCWGGAKGRRECPYPVKMRRSFAWPWLLHKLLHSLRLLLPVLAGQVLGFQHPSAHPVPLLQEMWLPACSSSPRTTARHRGSQQGPPHQDIASWGGGDPHLTHLPAPLCPSPAPDVNTVGHVSGMLRCQVGWLLAWHKPRELSSCCRGAAKHQAFSISAPNPISSFRGSTLQAVSMSKCVTVHQCLIKTSARLWAH